MYINRNAAAVIVDQHIIVGERRNEIVVNRERAQRARAIGIIDIEIVAVGIDDIVIVGSGRFIISIYSYGINSIGRINCVVIKEVAGAVIIIIAILEKGSKNVISDGIALSDSANVGVIRVVVKPPFEPVLVI
jgi:hypothetical protein